MTAHSTVFRPASNVLVYKIDYPRSIMLLEERIKAYNANATAASRIKVTHRALAEKLIRLLRKHFEDWQARNGFVYNPTTTPLPTLRVNNEFLGQLMECTGRTIRNYRDRLERLDLITVTILHGSNANFELAINPDFLWVHAGSNPLRFTPPVQSFPHTSSCTLPEPLPEPVQEPVCGKDFSGCGKDVDNSGTPFVTEPEQPAQPEPNHRNESSGEAARTTPPVAPPPPFSSAAQTKAARSLASWMLPRLYPHRHFNVSEKIATERMIEYLFAPVAVDKIPIVFQDYSNRCILAAQLWEIETGNPLPDPWIWFDPRNASGFCLTRSWLQPERLEALKAKIPPTPPLPAKRMQDTRIGETKIGNLFNQFKR